MTEKLYNTRGAVGDLILMEKIDEESIVLNLKNRHAEDLIYTYIGSVLISVNPFKDIKGLYDPSVLKKYQGRYIYENPPHVFALAEETYRTLMSERADQCVIISGESGAGKTEASKKIMQYVAAVSGEGKEILRVKDQILKSNPVLEAFGNAKTVRNNNSSRFGKYMEIYFDFKGDPVGGKVTNYLLEKSRIVQPAKTERGFHIFYQVMAGVDEKEKNALHLKSPEFFRYLSTSECYTVKGIDDLREFNDCIGGMKAMGLDDQVIHQVFRVVAAVLWIGQLDFEEKNERSYITDEGPIKVIAELLKCDEGKLRNCFVSRTLAAPENITTFLNKEGAYYTRDALAKVIYFRLFDQVVRFINAAITVNEEQTNINDTVTIGVLDIYGFEIFESNSFEQFCINFVNEKLQQIFILKTIQQEQEEYKKEGIQWEPVEYFNNKIVCDLIEVPKQGIFAYLDEECVLGKGTDLNFLSKLETRFKGHAHFQRPTGVKDSKTAFVLKHYAGDVTYNVVGFLDKNKDLLWKNLLQLGESSTITFFNRMFPPGGSERMGKARPVTAGFHFKKQVTDLMDTLNQCTPHYIRCIKPNDKKASGIFEDPLVLHQVRYLGLLENVRVRRAGFAFRQLFKEFLKRYKMIPKSTWPTWKGSDVDGCSEIMKEIKKAEGKETKPVVEGKDFQMGKTKLFIREPQTLFVLEEMRDKKMHYVVTVIQNCFRRWRAKKTFLELREKQLGLFGKQKLRRKVSVRVFYVGDYLEIKKNPKPLAAMQRDGGTKIRFADEVMKINRKYVSQPRILFLTDKHMYNMKPGGFGERRRVEIKSITGISLSDKADNFFVLHVDKEYDYIYVSQRKTEFVTAVSEEYEKLTSAKLPLTFGSVINYKLKNGTKRTITFSDDSKISDFKHGPNPSNRNDYIVTVGNIEVVNEQYINSLKSVKMSKSSAPPPSKWGSVSGPTGGGSSGTRESSGTTSGGASSGGASTGSSVSGRASAFAGRDSKVADTKERKSTVSPAKTEVKAPGLPKKKKREVIYVAIDDYTGGGEGELTFKHGDRIKILEQDPSGWWTGLLGNKIGYVPNTYLEPVP